MFVDVNKILTSNEMRVAASVKVAAEKLKAQEYFSIGDFFKEISNEHLQELSMMSELAGKREDTFQSLDNMCLLTFIFLQAEGIDLPENSKMSDYVNSVIRFVAITSLYRKGLVNANFENFSLDESFLTKTIVTKL